MQVTIALSAERLNGTSERTMTLAAAHAARVRALYKSICRLHRALPAELRVVGDGYVRDEFKRHKNAGADETRIFMQEWAVRL